MLSLFDEFLAQCFRSHYYKWPRVMIRDSLHVKLRLNMTIKDRELLIADQIPYNFFI